MLSVQRIALWALCAALCACTNGEGHNTDTMSALDDASSSSLDGADAVDTATGTSSDATDDNDATDTTDGDDVTDAADGMDTSDIADGIDGGDTSSDSGTIAATIRVIDPASGGGSSGVTIAGNGQEAITDTQGRATIDINEGPYRITLDKSGARRHQVFGVVGAEPFEQITYMSPDTITSFVFNSLGLVDDASKGILVVGLDLPNLAPAVGASASIDVESDAPFVFAGIQPTTADTIPPNGQGFLTFPNVTPGTVNVTVTYPDGACRVFPAETDAPTVEVVAGEVSIIAYTCRAE